MRMIMDKVKLVEFVNKQLMNFLLSNDDISLYIDQTLVRVNECFKLNKNKYYCDEFGNPYFSVFHSGQYSIFLYFLANTVYLSNKNDLLASKIYYLNKILHSVDWYYEIELPRYWGVEHPVGSVLGRARYGNGFFFYQGCTVGGNKGKYPVMGENVILYSNATVLGDTNIGNNVVVSSGTLIKDEIIPNNCIVFGKSPNLIIKEKDEDYMSKLIDEFWEKEKSEIRNTIPLSIPNLKGKELEYVTNAITTGWVSTGGPYVNDFEEKIASYVKTKGAVSCQNGTAGLHIALMLQGVSNQDEVIVPTLTFIAAINPVKYIGAEPLFMDCDDSLTIDVIKLLEFCENECNFVNGKLINKNTQKHVKVILVVHVFGNMADMEKIMEIADKFNLKVVEDATEALGTYYTKGKYKGRYAGTIGDFGVYSFNGNKIITTGGGGMIVSTDEELLKKAKHLTTQAKSDELYYMHDEIGYNYRMTNLQAALGIAQLEQLEQFIMIKGENYNLYKDEIKNIDGLKILNFRDDIRPNYWFYGLYCDERYNLNRDDLIQYLFSKKVQTRPIWGLINEQKPYEKCQTYKIEKAKLFLEHVVNIPCSSNLRKEDLMYVVECLK